MKPKVFIGIPNTGTIVRGLATNLCYWVRSDIADVVLYICDRNLPMMFNRNLIVKEFLKTDCQYLWWIDDDVVPPVDAFAKLLNHNADAVTGVAFCIRPNDNRDLAPYPVIMKNAENGEFNIYFPTQPYEEIDACGGGCVMVKRAVYEHASMAAPYQHLANKDGTLGMTCDFNVWRRAKEAGFKLFVDSTIVCSHVRDVDTRDFYKTLVNEARRKVEA